MKRFFSELFFVFVIRRKAKNKFGNGWQKEVADIIECKFYLWISLLFLFAKSERKEKLFKKLSFLDQIVSI